MTNWTLTTPFTGFASPAEPARPTGAAPLAGPRAEALPRPERQPFGFGRAVPAHVAPGPTHAPAADPKETLGLPALPSVDEHAWREALDALADPPAFRPSLTLVPEPADEAAEETADETVEQDDEGATVVHLWPRAADEDHLDVRADAELPAEPEPADEASEPVADEAVEAPAADESGFTVVSETKAPFWRRELSFRRTPKTEYEPQGEPEPVLETPGVEVVPAAVPFETEAAMVEAEPVEEAAEPVEPLVPVEAAAPVAVEQVLEVSPVGAELEPAPVAVVPELEPEPAPVAVHPELAPEPAPVAVVPEPEPEPEPEPAAAFELPEPVAAEPEAAPPAPTPVPVPAAPTAAFTPVPVPVPVATSRRVT